MKKFLLQYMDKFEPTLLCFNCATRQRDSVFHLTSLEDQILYYITHDLFHRANSFQYI